MNHQTGIAQLAIEYCNALVTDTTNRAPYFSGFNFNESYTTAFNNQTKRDQIFDPLITNMIGSGLNNQPTEAEVKDELDELIDRLIDCSSKDCSQLTTDKVVISTCAATLASAATIVQ